ncbi:MAG: beta-L-arabinofuranosidase domain-containing protein [Planctomycetota bacterium]
MKMKTVWVGIVVCLHCVLATACPAAGEFPEASRWEDAIQEFENRDQSDPPPKHAILFIGSSSIKGWDLSRYFPELETINRGFGGSHISDSVAFADRVILPYKPRHIVFYAGDNDIAAGKAPETVAEDFTKLVDIVHRNLPDTKISFIAIKPSIRRWELVDEMRAANGLIKEVIEGDDLLSYIDSDTPMIGQDGKPSPELFAPDGLHLNEKGYELWTALTRPRVAVASEEIEVAGCDVPFSDLDATNSHYVSNRPPLRKSALIKLPIGSIEPKGWLRKKLRLQADGFHGHLGEISRFLQKENNSWLSSEGEGEHGWEEVPYWLKGYLNCGYVLNDSRMIKEARIWIEGAINNQKEDGWFGPDKSRGGVATRLEGREDLWPNAIMLFCLRDYHEATGDDRVIELMTRYFQYLRTVPKDEYLVGYWPRMRGGDILHSIYWLYNRTGGKWLLELAEKNHERTARWDEDVINWHNVNISQAFGEAATWWLQSGEKSDLRSAYRNWSKVRRLYGQVPGGMFGADENAREGYDDPRQCVETCGMVEKMFSDETLIAITGDLVWADRCEDVAFNSLPAALTADMKAIRYLTAPNQPLSDAQSHRPGIQNGGPMFHMNPHRHRCCQHNFGHGWPYYSQHLWYATRDNGLACVLYGASETTAKVGPEGEEVTIEQRTHYPFGETVEFTIATDNPVAFPVYLRVPGWCEQPRLKVNGQSHPVTAGPGEYVRIRCRWQNADAIEWVMPMDISVRRWKKNHDSVSVKRGPLTYSLKIEEKKIRSGGTDKWPAWEIHPGSPWNYALALNNDNAAFSFELVKREWPRNNMPWTHEGTPLLIKTKGRRIPEWTLDRHRLCAPLQDSPAKTESPVEDISLIPMGAARLRISSFPVASDRADAHQWQPVAHPKPPLYECSASHIHRSDNLAALCDQLASDKSGDQSIPRFTWWDHKGTEEWVQYDFEEARKVSQVSVFWFDDTGVGQCRVPRSWSLLYRDDDTWQPVPGATQLSASADEWNSVDFEPVKTTALRLTVQLQPDFSGGILEWKIAE